MSRCILICGGRDYADADQFAMVLGGIVEPGDRIISGGARGADRLADLYAHAHGIPFEEYPADWKTHRRAAGMIRNREMLRDGQPDLVVAFPGGAGTANMMRLARKAGVPVIAIEA